MDIFIRNTDQTVFCITAESFPAGVKEAHEKLHAIFPPTSGRKYYGISYQNNGNILYKAAVLSAHPNEAGKLNLETFTIRKGKYSGKVIKNFMEDIASIGSTFQVLLENIHIDPEGYCLEEYFGNDVRCMVKLKDD
jgi:hypothetical protein